ncbi:MAG: hypothetical protein GPJ54_19700 [Candidatus Heimdallarchaeota archaeon]|nr:hypothetical protein [Candidatus Heimdallarchaeota archaeon]
MKHRTIVICLTLTLAIGFTSLNSTVLHAQPTPGVQCSNPTVMLTIESLTGLKFNLNNIQVPKASCVQITLVNKDPDIEHDFTIDGNSGPTGIETVYIPVGHGETNKFNVTTPDADLVFDYYCSIPGHRAAGEEGDFIVGEILSPTSTTELTTQSSFTETTEIDPDLQSTESDSLTLPTLKYFTSIISIIMISIITKRKIE